MMKFFKYLFILLFLLCLAIGGMGFYFYKTFNPNNYKTKIEEIASKALNRDLKINGDIKIALSFIPTIAINGIEIGNPEWATSPYFLRIGEADVTFKIKPLFDKRIEIDAINISNFDINLEVAKNGNQNWIFVGEDEDITQKAEDAKMSLEKEIANNPAIISLGSLMLDEAKISDGKITYFDARNAQKQTLIVHSLFSDYIDEISPLSINADVQYEGYRISGKISSGNINQLMNNPVNLPINMDISINQASVVFDGNISEISDKASISGRINAYNPANSFGLPETTLISEIEVSTKDVKADISTLNIATNLITGKINANISGKVPYVNATLKSKLINLESLNKNISVLSYLPDIIKVADAAPVQKNILKEKIDYSLLKILNGNIDLEIGQLIINKDFIVDGLITKAKMNNGILTINPLNLTFAKGNIIADAVINANLQAISANINTKNLILQEVLDNLKYTNGITFGFTKGGNTDIKANLKTRGKTYDDLLKNLNGNLIIILDKSEVRTGKFEFLHSNIISQILQVLKVYTPKDGKSTVNCAVIRTDIKNGIASFPNGIAIDTKNLTLISAGTINLDNKKIDLSLKPSSKNLSAANISQAVSSLIKIRGTLDDPKIGIDDAGAIKTLVGVVTTGPVMFGSQVLLDGDDYPCYTALEGTSEANRFPAPKGIAATTKKAYSTTSDSLDDTVKEVMSAAGEVAGGVKNAAGGLFNFLSGKNKKHK